ncbi:MAG: hypothetical protein J2P15_11360 [Micromonosporaceae bacterium]|nr:hypothetical protein [Micromonosporaceae bacterium]
MVGLSEAGVADAGPFLARLVRLNPGALVRLRHLDPDTLALWARLPWEVLVTRRVVGTMQSGGMQSGSVETDRTVAAADLLARLADPLEAIEGRDAQWRWPLPPSAGSVVETVPAEVIRRVGRAAASTVAEVGGSGLAGRPVGQRMVRDALLAHVPIVAESGGTRVEVSQRLVQAVLRMGFLGAGDDPVTVRLAEPWIGLAAGYGSAWQQRGGGLVLRPTR